MFIHVQLLKKVSSPMLMAGGIENEERAQMHPCITWVSPRSHRNDIKNDNYSTKMRHTCPYMAMATVMNLDLIFHIMHVWASVLSLLAVLTIFL